MRRPFHESDSHRAAVPRASIASKRLASLAWEGGGAFAGYSCQPCSGISPTPFCSCDDVSRIGHLLLLQRMHYSRRVQAMDLLRSADTRAGRGGGARSAILCESYKANRAFLSIGEGRIAGSGRRHVARKDAGATLCSLRRCAATRPGICMN